MSTTKVESPKAGPYDETKIRHKTRSYVEASAHVQAWLGSWVQRALSNVKSGVEQYMEDWLADDEVMMASSYGVGTSLLGGEVSRKVTFFSTYR